MYFILVSQTTSNAPDMRKAMWELEDFQDADHFAATYALKYAFVRLVGPNVDILLTKEKSNVPG